MELLATSRFCETCGSFASADMLSGFCPSCLLNTVLETETDSATGSRIEDYELLGEVARGGMGIVYRARQRAPSRVVALKMVLPAHLNSRGAIDRFRAEAEAAASLDHEGVLPIYAVGEHDGAPFYSMKFAEGGPLSARLDRYRERPREAAALIAKVSRAVAFAHEKGILHRDLKPANVLFDGADKPYVADFGLAKWLEREGDLTQTLGILGTPYYMAPEQATDSRAVTAAADIYSLGAILYHLLTGRPPISGATPMEVLHHAAAQKPKPIRPTNNRVPRDLETICLKCLEKEPASRYESAVALADDLERFCADQTIRARPAGLTSRGWRWSRRNPVLAALSATTCALAVVLLATLFAPRAPRESADPALRIAVLPFAGDNSLATGMQEEIIAHLHKVSDLVALSSRTITQAGEKTKDVRELRRAVGSSHVLRGQVEQANGRIAVTVQLIDTRTTAPVWTDRFENETGRIFAIQKEIAERVALRLKGSLTAEEKAAIEQAPTNDLEAYELYLHARSLRSYFSTMPSVVDQNKPQAVELLERAIARDPNFALAYAALSEVQADSNWGEDDDPVQLAKAKATAETAVRLAPQLAEGHLVLGSLFYRYFKAKERGLEEWRTAERLAPGNAAVLERLAHAATERGDWSESFAKLRKAREVEPLEPAWALQLGRLLYYFRHYAEAEQIADKMIGELSQESSSEFWWLKGDIALARSDPAAAEVANEKSDMARKGSTDIYHRMGIVALLQHRYAQAAQILKTIPDKTSVTGKLPKSGLNPFFTGHYHMTLGISLRAKGEKEKAQTAFATAESSFREWLRRQPEEPAALAFLAVVVAGQGRHDDTLREIAHAIEVFPLSREPIRAVQIREYVANAYAWNGDRGLALQLLQQIVRLPRGPTAGDLKLNPRWDDLREDPRFKQLIADAEKPISF